MRLSLLVASAIALAACGGGRNPTPPVHVPAASAKTATSSPETSPPPGLPPLAAMPAPGVAWSKKAKRKSDAALFDCTAGGRSAARDPAAEVKRLGEACAAASRMRPLGVVFRGAQGDRDAHEEQKLRVAAGKCYRVYFASADGVKDAVLVLRDSAGDVVAESPGAALPEDGAICFTSADEITLMVAVGSGKGGWAAQVWSD